MKRAYITFFIYITFLILFPSALSGAAATKPNVVIIMADDLGYGDVGYQGGDVPTPNIDSIARGGVTFTDGYVTCPAYAAAQAAADSDGTADEVTTLNLKSKLPFVDRSKFLTRGTITYSIPEQRDDGLAVGDAREHGDLTAILKLLNDTEKKNQDFRVGKGVKRKQKNPHGPRIQGNIDSLLIAKDGKLILEEYFADARVDRPHYQMSITKSVLAYAIGKTIELGKIKSDGDLILDYLPEVDRSKVADGVETLTIKDLLTMRSGIRVERAKKRAKITRENHAEMYLAQTQPIPAEKPYKYDGANVDLLAHILYNTTGKSLGQFTEQHLFRPMGITNCKFGKSACGLDKGAAGMALTSRDMLKIGLMTMHGGVWNGKQVLDPAWIEKATAVHVNHDRPHQYGYFWWSHKITVKGEEYRVRSARGAGGQFIFMLPELDLVAVFTSYYATNKPIQYFGDIIVPAFIE